MSLFCMSQSSVSFVISSILHRSCLHNSCKNVETRSYVYKVYYGAVHIQKLIGVGGGFHSCSIIHNAQMYARSTFGTGVR